MAAKNWVKVLKAALFGAVLVACSGPVRLEQPPNLFHLGEGYPAAQVPPTLRTTQATIFYVTDRKPVFGAGFVEGYTHERSKSMAFGETWVEFGRDLTWEQLVARSVLENSQSLSLTNIGFEERIRFQETPIPLTYRSDGTSDEENSYRAQIAEFRAAIAEEMRETGQRDVMIFVHGFNTDFRDALSTTAALYHYSGRIGLPISYSWPAGNPGVFKYFKDREAGEFSLFHLKEFLRALADVPGLEKLHIIAHSRGADVVTSALREMILVERGAGLDPAKSLKIETLVLAAPDLDLGVTQQRLIAERTFASVGQTSVYLNPNDGALGLAQRLATGTRFGRLAVEDLSNEEVKLFASLDNVSFINVEEAGGRLGHSFFRRNPAVFSDIVLTMRTGAPAGSQERPLEPQSGNFWNLHADYPAPRPVAAAPVSISDNE